MEVTAHIFEILETKKCMFEPQVSARRRVSSSLIVLFHHIIVSFYSL